MPEAHTSIRGHLVSLYDERIEDFIADTSMVRALHETEGFSETGLSKHAAELRQIGDELLNRFFPDSDTTESVGNTFWAKVLDLSLNSCEVGRGFVDAYAYMRVNRFLAAEFGAAETETTLVLRGIANEVVAKKLKSKSSYEIYRFFYNTFPVDMLDEIYPSWDKDNIRSDLEAALRKTTSIKLPYFDPALGKVLHMLTVRGCSAIALVPIEVRKEVAVQTSIHTSTRSLGYGLIDLNEIPVEAQTEEESADISQKSAEAQPVEQTNIAIPLTKKFDISKGLCRISQADDTTDELHSAMVSSMVKVMFPNSGRGVDDAREVCFECPVKSECLEFALANGIEHGVWGGESERSRRRILKELTKAAV